MQNEVTSYFHRLGLNLVKVNVGIQITCFIYVISLLQGKKNCLPVNLLMCLHGRVLRR